MVWPGTWVNTGSDPSPVPEEKFKIQMSKDKWQMVDHLKFVKVAQALLPMSDGAVVQL